MTVVIRIGEDTVSCRNCGHILFRCLNNSPQQSDQVTCLGCKEKFVYGDLLEGMRRMLAELRGLETETSNASEITGSLKDA